MIKTLIHRFIFLAIFCFSSEASFIPSQEEALTTSASHHATTSATIAAQENSYGAYFSVPCMNEQDNLEELSAEAEESLNVLEEIALALRKFAGIEEEERQGRSRTRNTHGFMPKRDHSPDHNPDALAAKAKGWVIDGGKQIFEFSRKSFDDVKPGDIEDLMWAKTGVFLIDQITAIISQLDDWSGTTLSTAVDVLDKIVDTARTAVRRSTRGMGLPHEYAQDLGDATGVALSLVTFRSFINSARGLGQVAKQARLIKSGKTAATVNTAKKSKGLKSIVKDVEATASKPNAQKAVQPKQHKTVPQENLIHEGNAAKTFKPGQAIRAEVLEPNGAITYAGKPGHVIFDGVEFRGVRDLSHMSERALLNMYKKGIAPKGIDEKAFVGHHYKQRYHREPGAFVVEIPKNKHDISNKIQHPSGNKKGAGLTGEQRKDWNKLRPKFYKERAKQELKRRGLLNEKK